MHSNQNQFIHQFSQKDKSVYTAYSENQFKLFSMLQNMHTNYPQKTQVYNHNYKPKSQKKNNVLKHNSYNNFQKRQNQEFRIPVTGPVYPPHLSNGKQG